MLSVPAVPVTVFESVAAMVALGGHIAPFAFVGSGWIFATNSEGLPIGISFSPVK